MFTLHLNDIRCNGYKAIESDSLQELIGQLVIAVISNKDFTYGSIRNEHNLEICNAGFKCGLNWLNINGVKTCN